MPTTLIGEPRRGARPTVTPGPVGRGGGAGGAGAETVTRDERLLQRRYRVRLLNHWLQLSLLLLTILLTRHLQQSDLVPEPAAASLLR